MLKIKDAANKIVKFIDPRSNGPLEFLFVAVVMFAMALIAFIAIVDAILVAI